MLTLHMRSDSARDSTPRFATQHFFDTTVRVVSLRTLFAGRGDPMVVQMQI
jgi:hypothetical protein